MEKIAIKIARWLGNNGGNQEEIEYYAYSIETILNYISTFGLLLIISALFNVVAITLIWMSFWVVLRYAAGGVHAATSLHCFFITLSMGIGSIAAILLLDYFSATIFIPIGIAFSIIVVFAIAPVLNENNPIPENKMASIGRRAKIIVLAESVLTIILFCVNVRNLAYSGVVAMVVVTILAMIGYLKNKCPNVE